MISVDITVLLPRQTAARVGLTSHTADDGPKSASATPRVFCRKNERTNAHRASYDHKAMESGGIAALATANFARTVAQFDRVKVSEARSDIHRRCKITLCAYKSCPPGAVS